MVDMLIPQSVRIKQGMEKPPRLIDDYEMAAALGLACRELGEPLPETGELSELCAVYAAREDLNATLRFFLGSREVNGRRKDWRRIMEAGYHYEG